LAKVSAHNSLGWGVQSSANTDGSTVRTIPQQMSAPIVSSYSDVLISLTWAAVTNSPANGGSGILGYQLLWDNGLDATPSVSLQDSLTTSFNVVSTMLTPGTTYKFALRARNIYGYSSSISTVVTVTAIYVPDAVGIPTVAQGTGSEATKVQITWSNPTQTHGSSVLQFQVQFRTSTESYVSDASCEQFTARSCLVDMSTIRTITGLTVNQLIRVRVRARNARGWGQYSQINSAGAVI
jgi:hypothetical protein